MNDSERIHEILSKVKELALELGKSPTIPDIEKRGILTRYEITKLFGGITPMLASCGMKPAGNKKIDNSIFNRGIEQHLEKHDQELEKMPEPDRIPYPKIMSISDIHWPFSNNKLLEKFYARVATFKPKYIFINGDAWDMYSHTKFPRTHNLFTPKEERSLSRKMNETFWAEIQKRAPKDCKLFQMLGNHDVRPMKRILESYPEGEEWVMEGLKKDFTFEGVTTIYDPREEVVIGDIVVFHGHRSGLGEHRDYSLYNCIVGHTHQGGTVFRRIRGNILWEANSGLAGDPTAKGLTYTPTKITKWTAGWIEVDDLGPRFVPDFVKW